MPETPPERASGSDTERSEKRSFPSFKWPRRDRPEAAPEASSDAKVSPNPGPAINPSVESDRKTTRELHGETNGDSASAPSNVPRPGQAVSKPYNPSTSPFYQEPAPKPVGIDKPAINSGGGRTRILYVEDNPDNRMLLQRVLMVEGHDVIFAETAMEALEIIKKDHIDLILMDINLPDIDGYALTVKIRQIPKFLETPIVALTANVMQGDREKSIAAGCDGYIQKPIDVDLLPGQISEYLIKR